MDAISRRLENQYPDDNEDTGIRVTPVARRSRRRNSAGLASSLRSGRVSPFHRLRECREPFARPRRDPIARNFHPRRDGREPLPVDPAIAYRKRAPLGHRRRTRRVARRVGDSAAHGDGAARPCATSKSRSERRGARVQPRRVGYHRHSVSGLFRRCRLPPAIRRNR